jgi:drug/metabolite transporter (DMT)-like permease
LLVYTFPVIVAVTAIVLGRDRASRRTAAVLTLATAGLALVLSTAATGTPDLVGTALGLGAALVYSAYVLAGEGVASRVRPQMLAALVCSGAAASLTTGAALLGELHPAAVTPAGWGWLACLAGISTVASIGLFFAGLWRVGPTRASILSTLEPVVAALLAVLVFGEVLRPPQILGIGLVLGAVLALQMRPRAAAAGSAARLDATLCAKRTRPVAITDAVRRSTA